MTDDTAAQVELQKPIPAVDEPAGDAAEITSESHTVRVEAHKVGVEAVERALSVPT